MTMPTVNEGPAKTFTAAVDVIEHRIGKLNTNGDLVYATATDTTTVGVITNAVATGQNVAVHGRFQGYSRRIEASGAIAIGVAVFQAANGRVAATGTVVAGIALNAAAAAGDIVEVTAG